MSRSLFSSLAVLALLAVCGAGRAGEPRLVLGDVESVAAHADAAWVREAAREEIAATEAHAPAGARVVLSVAVLSADTAHTPQGTSSSCEVSFAVRDAKKGTLLATLRGRAQADGAPARAPHLERAAARQALQSALAMLPQAL